MNNAITRTRKEAYYLWIGALRSGKYRRMTGQLSETREGHAYFCALGLLCELARRDGGDAWQRNEFGHRAYKNEETTLPEVIRKFMGLSHAQCEKIAELNDRDDYSFRQMADYIETKILPKVIQ